MRLDFLYDMTAGGKFPHADPVQLLRIFDFTHKEAMLLSEKVAAFAATAAESLSLHELEFMKADDLQLRLQKHDKDLGILMPEDKSQFLCLLQTSAFYRMAELIITFAHEDAEGYHWLYDPKEDGIDLLMSKGGSW